jgi:hypothetical protein
MRLENQTELSVGGPAGIQIRGHVIQTGSTELAPINTVNTVSPVGAAPKQDLSAALALVRKHPQAVAAGLALAGVAMLVGPAIVIGAIGLPWILYLGPIVMSTTAFGLSVAALRAGPSKPDHAALEQRILDLAVRSGGQLTVAATAHALQLPMRDVEETLRGLARADHVEIENDTETGAVLYVFRDLRGQLGPGKRP